MSTEIRKTLEIQNKRGLHARAAAKFVKCAERFEAEVIVSKDENSVSGTSIMGLMMLAAAKGSQIQLLSTGAEADELISALEALINDKFGEDREETIS